MENPKNEVSPEIVYTEIYNEMRRYRDYEITSSTWYIVILLAILSVIITIKFSDPSISSIAPLLKNNLLVQFIFSAIYSIIGGSSIYAIRFANLRYEELRKYVNNLEPSWNKFTPKRRRFTPRHSQYLINFLLIGATNYLIFSPPEYNGLIATFISCVILFIAIFCLIK